MSSVRVTAATLINSLEICLPLQDLHNIEPKKILSWTGVRLIEPFPSLRIYWSLIIAGGMESHSSSV